MAVYFVQAGEDGPIKIGFAADVRKRLSGLQVNCPARIRPLGMVDGDKSTERQLHSRFAHLRVCGEWFTPAPELLALIAEADPFPPRHSAFVCPVGRQWTLDEIVARAGSVTKLAAVAGVHQTTISAAWRRKGRVPVDRCRRVHDALGIPLHELRPDVWLVGHV
jgi:hypothetical protein